MENASFIKEQLTQKLLEVLPKQYRTSDSKQRKFLISCIEDLGYIKARSVNTSVEPEPEPESEPEQDPEPGYFPGSEDYQILEQRPGPSSNIYGFNRTFITPDTNQESRLVELQKRGISTEETELGKVSEIIEAALNKTKRPDIDTSKIKEFALKLYQRILGYYRDGNMYNLKSNSQTIKKGYIALVTWYSLINFQINISREKLVSYFDRTILSDLFEPEKYMGLIFGEDLPKRIFNLCGINNLPPDLIGKIYKVLEQFENSSPKYTAAAVYFVCSVDVHHGGIVPKKIKGVTLEFLEKNCKISQSTISKGVKEIIGFYSSHPELKSVLLAGHL